MNRTLALLVLASGTALIGAGCTGTKAVSASQPDATACGTNQPACTACACIAPPGASTAVNATTADALRETLQDERRVQAFYTNVMAKYGQVRPFSNIVHAEERHAAVVEALMTRHGVAIPGDGPGKLPAVPGTLAECNRLAAQLERDNIAMYDRLLAGVTEPDIRTAFENLRAASKNNHLPAFERWSVNTGSGTSGRAMGYGRGYGRGVANASIGVCRGPCTTAQ